MKVAEDEQEIPGEGLEGRIANLTLYSNTTAYPPMPI